MQPVFVSGIGTGVGKTLVAAIVTEALDARYWKPVQAGFDDGSDTDWVRKRISRPGERLLDEAYRLILPASPHISAREEGIVIDLDRIARQFGRLQALGEGPIVIEGAGGLLVPLNQREFMIDLIAKLGARVLLVSRNYLGSINHSLLSAAACKSRGLEVAGWIFNDQYLHYEDEIVTWTGLPAIASIPFKADPNAAFVREQAARIRPALLAALGSL
ncbi:MAG TPA: dethiobiotin synthase [Puia sp.]|nr:dethiobiotin synthase [Puia sp.]